MFYERVQRLCLEKGISITALATELGFGKGTPSGWKRGVNPNEGTIKRIADFFDVSPLVLSDIHAEPSISASNIQNSNVVQGNRATTLIVRNGERVERVLSEREIELLRVYNSLDVKSQTRLLTFAFDLEGESDYVIAARGNKGIRDINDKKEKEAFDRALSDADDLHI